MANNYVVTSRLPRFRIEKMPLMGTDELQVSAPVNFTEAKKLLKQALRDSITELKLQLKTVGSMRKDV